jgi:hypothetical protein
MLSKRVDTSSLIFALQAVVDGRDADEIIDHVLVNMAGRKDAVRLFPDDSRARRRIENRLRHASAAYARLCRQTFDLFREAIEEEGLQVSPDFASDNEVSHVPLEKILERVSQAA